MGTSLYFLLLPRPVPTIFSAQDRFPEERFGYSRAPRTASDGSVWTSGGMYSRTFFNPRGSFSAFGSATWIGQTCS